MAKTHLYLFSFLKSKKFLYTLGSLIGIFLLLNYVALPIYVNHGSTLYVPRVIGLQLERARVVLDSAGLQAVEAETRADPVEPPGTVISQNPLPQSTVKSGRRIYLSISGGDVLVPVPLLRGRSSREAGFALERVGLRLGGTGYATSDAFPENTIIDQSVPPETKVARGSAVNIVVSRGLVVEETTIPSVVGKTTTEAGKLLADAGLKLGNITYQPSFDLLPNTVVDQYPRAGEPAKRGQAVDLFVVQVGKPTEEIQVPKK
jgi:beta-lactam-binding protein with PASTA domain